MRNPPKEHRKEIILSRFAKVVFKKDTVFIKEQTDLVALDTKEMKTLINEFYKYQKEIRQ